MLRRDGQPVTPFILACIAVLVFAASMTGRAADLYWNQAHHAYYGWAVTMLGVVAGSSALLWVGALIAADDACQHALQNLVPALRAKRPSLLYQIYARTLARLTVLARLNRWLDTRLR